MKKDNLLVCTFSGGRTSAFMAKFLMNLPKYKNYDKVFIFANTGKEREETLKFINDCDKKWGLGIVWLEANVIHKKGVGTNYKIVDYKTASRNGEPFYDMAKKYPLPNNFVSNCTRELKLAPMNKYVKSLVYKNVFTAMGIRYDERHRESNNAKQNKIIYPLIYDIKVDNKFIRDWWERQSFDLNLKDYEGNCDLCFKKSLKKRLTIIKENPSVADWWLNFENEFKTESNPRMDLRTGKTIQQLVDLSKNNFTTAKDLKDLDNKQAKLFDFETDCTCKET